MASCSFRAVVFLATLLGIVCCQSTSEAQSGQRTNTKMTGEFVRVEGNAIVIKKSNGSVYPLQVTPADELKIRGRATPDFLVPGTIVEIFGDSDSSFKVTNPQITAYAGNFAPRQRTNGGSYYTFRASRASGKIPIALIGTIVSVDPLRVKGGNSIRSRYWFEEDRDSQTNASLNYRDFPVLNTTFEVSPDPNRVFVDLGNLIKFAKEGDEITVYDYRRGAPGSTKQIQIYLKDPVDLESLGIKPKPIAKSKKRVSRTKSLSKKSSEKKSDDSGDSEDTDDKEN